MRAHTHTHTHTHTCYIDPAIVGSTGRKVLLESSAVRAFHLMSSMVVKCIPLRPIFGVGNSQKSLGARFGEYGGWVMTGMLFSARNCGTTSDVWLGAFAPSQTSLVMQQFLAEKSIPVITRPPYSPDLVPSDFWLFSTLQMGPKGDAFRNHGRHRMRRPNSGRFQKKPPAGASNNCRIDGASVCVCVCVCVCARAQGSYFEGD